MGKYMKKPKITCDVALMEVVGVRTRAKTLALQKKLQSSNLDTSSYLELRSRKLQKFLSPQNPSPRKTPNSGLGITDSVSVRSDSREGARFGTEFVKETEDGSVEASFGENNLEFDCRGRSTRESTPCSFIREPVSAETPCSTTRNISSNATNRITQRNNPTTREIDDFFASIEKQQHKLFAEKYNFDVVNDVPLPGRYEWVKVEN